MALERIAIVVGYFPTVSQTFIVNQINGLLDVGADISLFAYKGVEDAVVHESLNKHDLPNKVSYFTPAPKSKLKRIGVFLNWTIEHFNRINWKLFFRSLNVIKYGKDAYTLKLFFESQWFLVDNDFSLIHAHFGMNGNRIAYLKSRNILKASTRLITTFHGFDLKPNNLKTYIEKYKYLLENTDALTVNTPYLGNLLEKINNGKKPIHILPMGLDTGFFKKESHKKEDLFFDIVFCGKLIPLKGPDLAIQVTGRLRDLGFGNIHLHIVGDGEIKTDLIKMVEDMKLQEQVYFKGSLTQQDLKNLLDSADVFILPGRYEPQNGRAETQGLVLQEAQAMQVPVVISDVGGMKYGVVNKKTGFIVKEEDVNVMADAIKRLIEDPKLRQQMGKNAREFVESNYDSGNLAEKLVEIYEDTLK